MSFHQIILTLSQTPLWLELIIYALAAWRITRLLVEDHVLSRPRDAFWRKFPPETSEIGYLLTCYWCLGAWVSTACVLAIIFAGIIGLAIALIFALSALVGIVQHLLDR
jgi:hypothetical protein